MNDTDCVYTKEEIRRLLKPVFLRHGVKRAVLFGSYSKGNADGNSDIDLMVDSGLRGLSFIDLVEDARETTHKDIDMLDITHIEENSKVDIEIKNTGTEIYAE
ncbi:MAG: nucleotidyltransferase domain-containing protein [Oribacterium sp.]|jgi:hypothetical protein|nr:nucleotidyltransferase domain-containing protein [Oribacterium sp.]MDY6307309.1 nucleotidyltransferase domain-containing protein [Oribacterium sp.]